MVVVGGATFIVSLVRRALHAGLSWAWSAPAPSSHSQPCCQDEASGAGVGDVDPDSTPTLVSSLP